MKMHVFVVTACACLRSSFRSSFQQLLGFQFEFHKLLVSFCNRRLFHGCVVLDLLMEGAVKKGQ